MKRRHRELPANGGMEPSRYPRCITCLQPALREKMHVQAVMLLQS